MPTETLRRNTCDWCLKSGLWSESWSQWGTPDQCVFTACSDACAAKIEPHTRFIGKPQGRDGSGKWLARDQIDRAQASLAAARKAAP